MDVNGSSTGGVERRKLAERLSQFQGAERKRFARYRDVLAWCGRDQREDAGVWTALVQLTSRVQIPRSVAEHSRGAGRVDDRAAQRLQGFFKRRIRTEIGEQSKVIALPQQRENTARARLPEVLARHVGRRDLDPAVDRVCSGRARECARLLKLPEQRPGRVLGLLHVRLVERVVGGHAAGAGGASF